MGDDLKGKAKKVLEDARGAARAVMDDVSTTAHESLVGTEDDVRKVSGEVRSSVNRAVEDAKLAADEARKKLRKQQG